MGVGVDTGAKGLVEGICVTPPEVEVAVGLGLGSAVLRGGVLGCFE